MRVIIFDHMYTVQFVHQIWFSRGNNHKKERYITTCLIHRDDVLICQGIAKLNPADVLNKNLGKAMAMDRALITSGYFTSDTRGVFWSEFHKNFPIRKRRKNV